MVGLSVSAFEIGTSDKTFLERLFSAEKQPVAFVDQFRTTFYTTDCRKHSGRPDAQHDLVAASAPHERTDDSRSELLQNLYKKFVIPRQSFGCNSTITILIESYSRYALSDSSRSFR